MSARSPSMQNELESIRAWAKAKIADGTEPPWAWYQYMKLIERLCLESGGNWFWRLSERVEFCGGQAARSRVSSAIS